MLDAIRFAAAAVARKDYVSGLTHFKLGNGRITGFNGRMSLSAELGVDLEAKPLASTFLAAVRAAGEETISLNMTPAGRLAVRAGKFRAFVTCDADQQRDFIQPSGDVVDLGPAFMDGIRTVAPVMGVDASRPQFMGVKLQAGSMFATNNVMIIQYWHGTDLPLDVVIPAAAVHELLRAGQPPVRVQVSPSTITFWLDENRWLLTVLQEGSTWPLDRVERVLNGPFADLPPVPEGFFDAVATLKPFLDEETTRIYVTPEGLRTSMTDGDGANVEVAVPGVTAAQPYSHRQLTILRDVADAVDWTCHPAPLRFSCTGKPMRGVMVGMRS